MCSGVFPRVGYVRFLFIEQGTHREFWPSVVAVRTSHVLPRPWYSVERYSYPHAATQNFGLQRKYLQKKKKTHKKTTNH